MRIRVRYLENVPKRLYGDSLRLSQILNNLLSNAVKFTQSGEVILIISRIEENIFRFEVKDTGIGLKREEQKKIFNAFSQADGSTTRDYGGDRGLGFGPIILKTKVWLGSFNWEGSELLGWKKVKELLGW